LYSEFTKGLKKIDYDRCLFLRADHFFPTPLLDANSSDLLPCRQSKIFFGAKNDVTKSRTQIVLLLLKERSITHVAFSESVWSIWSLLALQLCTSFDFNDPHAPDSSVLRN